MLKDWRDLSGWSLLVVALALFVAGILNEPPWKQFDATQRVASQSEPANVARSLLRDGTFANPFSGPTGATAHLAPAWPVLLACLLKLFGTGAGGWLAIRWVPVLAMSAQYALLPVVAPVMGFSRWTGVIGALFGLLFKPAKEEMWEAHLAGLMGLLLTAVVCWFLSRRGADRAWAAGLLAGFTILLQPVIGVVYLGWLLLECIGSAPRNSLAIVVGLICGPLLICAPWMVRNHAALGVPYTIRDNLGLELDVSFNDCAPYGFLQSTQRTCFYERHPNTSAVERAMLVSLGEYAYNQDRWHRAVSWISDHCAQSLSLLAQRSWFFWFPSDDGWSGYAQQRKRMLALHVMTIASLGGLWLAWRRQRRAAPLLLSWVAVFPLIYYAIQFVPRYRYPMLWVTWLCAAECVWTLVCLRIGARDRGVSR